MPVYDPESMGIAAGQVEKILERIEETKRKMTPMEGENPFGSMTPPEGSQTGGSEGAKGAVGSFQNGMNSEFDAAAGHMTAASDFLRRAAGLLQETEQVHMDNLTVHYDRQDKA
ncbi:hypothetical protein CFN78_20045 [Amycolatopsis antarctica]|uniref:PE domain-containing protein n=1 Tax=Amycolatopsis antarctica TaxID=1854586 RepID=A0A263D227_9PSEU|nr:hypothetical protein [Amycolatopsis antarctica]OZM71546.1 hypothetical protein CFN78_20045 [Amycolatopsis antarctica]